MMPTSYPSSGTSTLADNSGGSTDSTSTGCSWWVTYSPPYDILDEIEEMLLAIARAEQSKNWQPAPRVILPHIGVLLIGATYHRRIGPRQCTGRNYHRDKVA